MIETHTMVEDKKEEHDDFFAQDFGNVHASQSATSLGSDAFIGHDKEGEGWDKEGKLCFYIFISVCFLGPKVEHISSPVETKAPVSAILKKPVKKPIVGWACLRLIQSLGRC